MCRTVKFFHRSQQTISVWTSRCSQGHRHAETGKGTFVKHHSTVEKWMAKGNQKWIVLREMGGVEWS
jgi:hypothetical protein